MFTRRAFIPRAMAVYVVCALLNTGCSETLSWVRPGADPAQADQQEAACTLDAEKSYMSSDESPETRAARIAHWVKLCMRTYGWRQQQISSS